MAPTLPDSSHRSLLHCPNLSSLILYQSPSPLGLGPLLLYFTSSINQLLIMSLSPDLATPTSTAPFMFKFLRSTGPHPMKLWLVPSPSSLSTTHLFTAPTPSHSTLSNYFEVQTWASAHTI